ncbi:hypothetical protein CUMW_251770 [Citrus unshiu]|uniref:Uncharacterized protein n=1 Tax=Citrus unshiu TaxID=55188 RepID=A0A2H5QQF8_CITUN|nr:hypothetical protein CUMW_251770 [Citrus unshiu]
MERGGGSVAARVWRTHRLMFLTMAKGGDPGLKLIDFWFAKASEFGRGVGWQRSQLNRGGLSGEAHSRGFSINGYGYPGKLCELHRIALIPTNGARRAEVEIDRYKLHVDRKHIKHFINYNLINKVYITGFVCCRSNTTSVTMEWAMAEPLQNPKALSKVKLELEEIIAPRNSLITSQKALEDREIANFIVLKCAKVLVNVWATVRYERSDIDFKGKNFELIPFGAGWQIYPGLPFAIKMLYLILGSFINSFDWKLEDKNMDMKKKKKLP